MKIIIPIEVLSLLFPDTKGDLELLKKEIKNFYIVGSTEPKIDIRNDIFHISIDIKNLELEQGKYNKLLSLCENEQYEEAESLAFELIKEFPTVSEYYRILGQVQSEMGNSKQAIDSLIDALRWNPENVWALLMMGNIFALEKDIETALRYYNQVLKLKPNDNITLNNIGAQLMQAGKRDEALGYFYKAIEADPEYPNSYFALALVFEKERDYFQAFQNSIQAASKSPKKSQLYQNSIVLALECSKNLVDSIDTDSMINDFISELKVQTKKEIKIEEDSAIATAAKIEFAEVYNRDFHLIKYKPTYPAVSHLILHELVHLELADEARRLEENQLFTSNQTHKKKFFHSLEKNASKLRKKGISDESINSYFSAVFDGINSQIFNTPIDLFIEDRLYSRYPKLQPLQFFSLFNLIREGIEATTKKEIVSNAPKSIISKSKILNLVNALHFRDLYSIDMLLDHKPTSIELKEAEGLYKEFQEYRNNKEPGEEYELIQHWGEDLNLDNYFQLIPESEHKRKTVDSVINDLIRDPFGIDTDDSSNERKMKKFIEDNSSETINMAVAMYMADALVYFQGKPKSEIKKTAFELATIGMAGINPKKKGYSIPSIKGSSFSGYKTLSYYYVSWALAMPEMLESLQMPFDKEYTLATKFLQDNK